MINIETIIATLNKAVLYFEDNRVLDNQEKLLSIYSEAKVAAQSLALMSEGKEKSGLLNYLTELSFDFDTYFVARHG